MVVSFLPISLVHAAVEHCLASVGAFLMKAATDRAKSRFPY
jgi:hypothetical protein